MTSAVSGWTDRDLHAWAILRPLLDAGGYLPWSEGAMRPSGLVDVCNEIVLGPRRRVLELGSGVSTVVLGRLLRTTGGTLVAVEHDARWCAWVAERIVAEGLEATVSVLHAPLEPLPEHALPWYARRGTDAALASGAPDLLIVDGPPAFRPEDALARLPALSELLERLAPGATIVLDDIARPGERAVLERWERETALRFERRPDAGIAVAKRPPPA
ncbi:MAG TPA: class I SAM-dependent methyltransferase [Baekduia sp.]|nr:class I SAM-dependent methyltransferase [Baekduia sp.]